MESRRVCVLLLGFGIFLSAFGQSEGAPLQYHYKSGESTGDTLSVSIYLSLVVSLTVLVALVVVLVNCVTCCKEREINFKEFEDHFDDEIDFTPPAEDTPSMQSPAEVYTLAVSPVPLPGPPHLQPPVRITEGSAGFQVARHSLSYIQEIGNGWFGQVLLSEIYTDPGGTRVVVKELKANASAKEQNDFLQQGDPYRVLQHPNILQCLGQCVEAIPFLLVFEYCEMGDLRGYLSQQDWMLRNAELLQLQRMACEIAAGVTHLHKHNFLHSDLALRNCYLTADLTVKVGDYGIGPYRYKEDYIITEDDVYTPLRWLAPELVGERHGGVITMEQTKPSNVWALGVTLWELFENATQPYPHLSDREVLNHVIKEQQVKLFKPQLELPYSDRWYEVLQFCWLSPDKRATAEEVHRLLIYLRMQGQKDIEEDFEQRWDALKPNPITRQTTVSHSSFPILEQFADDTLRQEIDEILTVTETSKGLSFEYVWEAAKHDHYDGNHGHSGVDTTLNYHSMFFPVSSEDIQAHFPDPSTSAAGAESGNTPSGIPGIVPVFDAQKPSNGNEYYIQLEEQGESTVEEDGNREPGMGFGSSGQDFVVLQDVQLDESSTDADFFHQSIDSKDSYLPDSHIWSSLENDSPYHTNIFTEDGSKQEDSPSWKQTFMELPERTGNPFLEGATLEGEAMTTDGGYEDAFLGEPTHLVNSVEAKDEKIDGKSLLSTEKLADNFMFLKDQTLLKEGSGFSSPQQNFLLPGLAHEPEDAFKMNSWDNLETLGSLNTADTYFKSAASSTSSRHELLDSPSTSLGELCQSLENEILVPSITVVTEDDANSKLPARNTSSTEDLGLLQSSNRGIDSGFDSTSERFEVLINYTDGHTPAISDSAKTDSLCTDAKIPSLEYDLGTSKDDPQPIESKMPETLPAQALSSDNGHGEDLTSNDLLSELIEDADLEMETTLSDHEESFMDPNGRPHDRASLLVSGPSLDQISQDSLLEDSMSTTVPTIENSAETPDSLDSLDIHRLGEQGDDLNAQIAQHKLQPPYRISDSGYETENLESPEWNSQPNVKDGSPVKNGVSVTKEEEETEEHTSMSSLVPPKIVISEVEGVPDTHNEDPSEIEQPDNEGHPEEPLIGSNYRDSAYFSDNESEPEKKSEEMTVGGSVEDTWLRNSTDDVPRASGGPALEAYKEKDIESFFSLPAESQAEDGETPCAYVEEIHPMTDSDITENCENQVTKSTNSYNEDGSKPEAFKDAAFTEHLGPSEDLETSTVPSVAPSVPATESVVHAKLTRTHASDGHKIKEPDVEGRYLGRRDGSGLDGQEDGMDADEEDENSDDSDDDMRAYQMHSSSSESEDETVYTVPVIISDNGGAKNLKSLLKPTSLNIEASSSPFPARFSADNSKRTVSFFDDVTVYLFDQETPTKELGDHSSDSNSQVPQFSSPTPTASYLNRFTNSESSTDEEGGGFEWDDDFSSPAPAFLSKTGKDTVSKARSSSAVSSFSSPATAVGSMLETSWTGSSSYSRFSISPASIASFSLTHLTDSDIEQGGSSEDGEKD